MKWRKWNNILHRDIGYLCVGLTLVYVISGIAVNHLHHWNPNFAVEKIEHTISPIITNEAVTEDQITAILTELGMDSPVNNHFQSNPAKLQIFLENSTIEVDLRKGIATEETISDRTFFQWMNFLHLNTPKDWWTWVADLYALCLAILAITGLFVIKGKKGIKGRGAWLTAIGIAVPIIFLLIYN